MRRILYSIVLIFSASALILSCGGSDKNDPKAAQGEGMLTRDMLLEGDKTVYGLACEGCTDSVVVLLPMDGSDPIRYDIIDATRLGKVLGKPNVGDWIGVVLNEKDSTVADMVIDLDELKGTWCYIVMPQMKDYESMSPRLQARMMRDMPDSVKETYLIPREYGFTMGRHWTAGSVGYVQESTLDNDNPVVYPPLGYFTEWHIWNGKLVVTSGKPTYPEGKDEMVLTEIRYDTCDIVYLKDDSLVLASDGMTRSYYRRTNVDDINRKAREMAAKMQQKALDQLKE